jgi:hypothetical protein
MSQSSKPVFFTSLIRVNSLAATAHAANKVRATLTPSNIVPLSLPGMLPAAPASSAHGLERTWSSKRVLRLVICVLG